VGAMSIYGSRRGWGGAGGGGFVVVGGGGWVGGGMPLDPTKPLVHTAHQPYTSSPKSQLHLTLAPLLIIFLNESLDTFSH